MIGTRGPEDLPQQSQAIAELLLLLQHLLEVTVLNELRQNVQTTKKFAL